MDTSKEYIEMCKDAIEIQKIHQYNNEFVKSGDWFSCKFHEMVIFEDGVYPVCDAVIHSGSKEFIIKERRFMNHVYLPERNRVWLPRQDQLQDMIGTYQEAYSLMYHYKNTPLYSIGNKPYYPFNVMTSAEILWLCFVMHELYSKKWSGTEWVSE